MRALRGLLAEGGSVVIADERSAEEFAAWGVIDRVVPVDGKPGIRPMLTLTLSSDHRVVDGAQAALFLNDLAEAIGSPEKHL